MAENTQPDTDIVDRLLAGVDHGLDLVHDKVLRPIILAGRAIAYGLIIALAAVVFVIVLVIGSIRLLNVYVFSISSVDHVRCYRRALNNCWFHHLA